MKEFEEGPKGEEPEMPEANPLNQAEVRKLSLEEQLALQAANASERIRGFTAVNSFNGAKGLNKYIIDFNRTLDISQNIILPQLLKLKSDLDGEKKEGIKNIIEIFQDNIKQGEYFLRMIMEDAVREGTVSDQDEEGIKIATSFMNDLKNQVMPRFEKNKLEKSVAALQGIITLYEIVIADQSARLGLKTKK